MPNELVLVFSAEKIKSLLEANPDKIAVRSTIEEATLNDGSKAGVVKVYADAYVKGKAGPVATVSGCPVPPCAVEEGS
jgi:hypothetical protein